MVYYRGETYYDIHSLFSQLKAKRNIRALLKFLGDKDDRRVRQEAAKVLGELKDRRAEEALIATLKDKDIFVRQAAASALGKIGDSGSVEPLIGVLNGDISTDVRGEAATALGYIGDARAVEPLIAVLNDEDSEIRWKAAEALGMIRDTSALTPLLAALRDRSANLPWFAALALEEIGWQPGRDEASAYYWIAREEWASCVKIGEPAVAPLIGTLTNIKQPVREAAAAALDKLGWQPKENESAAYYWITKQEWNECLKLGELSVQPLITLLETLDHKDSLRFAVATTLVKLYKARGLSSKAAQSIFHLRGAITASHIDTEEEHYDKLAHEPNDTCNPHSDIPSHREHKSVEFPL